MDYKPHIDKDEIEHDHKQIRRLYLNLKMPRLNRLPDQLKATSAISYDDKNLSPLQTFFVVKGDDDLNLSHKFHDLNQEESFPTAQLIELLKMSNEANLSDVITSFGSFKAVFTENIASLNEFMNRWSIKTEMSEEVTD